MSLRSTTSLARPASPQTSAGSTRNEIGPISNAVLYIVFCLLAATGLAMTFRLDNDRASLLGLLRQDWARVHALAALSLLSLVALHLWVNWGWLRSMLARLRWHTIVVAFLGLAMVALALLAPVQ